jgi:hypothetical protein
VYDLSVKVNLNESGDGSGEGVWGSRTDVGGTSRSRSSLSEVLPSSPIPTKSRAIWMSEGERLQWRLLCFMLGVVRVLEVEA